MDLKALRYFVKAVETGSFSSAAKACFVAQPSITLAIANLESELHCQLFVRHRKGCSPTADGMKLFIRAEQLLFHAKSIQNEFMPQSSFDSISLCVDSNIRIELLEGLIKRIRESKPITFSLLTKENESEADLYLTTYHEKINSKNFIPLARERYVLLVPSTHPLAFAENIQRDDLNNQPLIKRINCENQVLFEQITKTLNLNFNVVAEVQTEEWALSLVRAGLGICFAPVPTTFQDKSIIVKELESTFSNGLPVRVIGLEVKNRAEYLKDLLKDFQ